MTSDDEQDLDDDDEFADEDEPLDVAKYITPEYVAWLNKVSGHATEDGGTGDDAIDEQRRHYRKMHDYHWTHGHRLRDESGHLWMAAREEVNPHIALALRIISEATMDLGREHMCALVALGNERAPVRHRPWHDR